MTKQMSDDVGGGCKSEAASVVGSLQGFPVVKTESPSKPEDFKSEQTNINCLKWTSSVRFDNGF